MGIRAYLDTNLYVSYLLSPPSKAPPAAIIRSGISGAFTILFGEPTLRELLGKVVGKRYLQDHISMSDVEYLLETLEITGERVTNAPDVIPAVGRDRNDDYLLTYSRVGAADYLVTGDKDLLVLERVDNVLIVTPAEFLFLLEHIET